MALITIEQASRHLKLAVPLSPSATTDLNLKMEMASAIVINHLKRPDHEWTDETDPSADVEFAIVQAAILKVLGNLFRFRGDDEKPPEGPMSADVKAMLTLLRDPTLA